MDLLYWLDRSLTRGVQRGSRWLSRHHLSVFGQRSILLVVGITAGLVLAALVGKDLRSSARTFSLQLILTTVVVITCWVAANPPVRRGLILVHRWLDPDADTETDKEYRDGERFWADVVITVGFILIGARLSAKLWADPLVAQSVGQLGYMGLLDLLNRKAGPRKRRGRVGVTAAMSALMDRCRDFIPQAQPVAE